MARNIALLAGLSYLAASAQGQKHGPPSKPWDSKPDRPPWKHHGGWDKGGWGKGGWGKPPKGPPMYGSPSATGSATGTGSVPSSTAGLPLVDAEALQAAITEENLSDKALELQEAAYSTPQRNRVFGSPGSDNTIELITGYLDTVPDYFSYYLDEFVALYSQADGNLTINGVEYESSVFDYSPSGDVSAPLVLVDNLGCEAGDYPSEVEGAIALIQRGTCAFGLKSGLAGGAGAVAAIIYNNAPAEIGGGTLGEPPGEAGPYVPSMTLSGEDGTSLVDMITAGETLTANMMVDSVIENRTTYNVIAQTVGGDPDNVLALGGHLDSVYAGPGINDDGSGIIGILEVALQLASYRTNNAVRFCFWSAEEFGLLGSEHYVTTLNATEQQKIRLYLNFDMIASPNYIFAILDGDGSAFNLSGPPGSAEAEAFFEQFYAGKGVNSTPSEFNGRSDYGPFLDANIAAGGLFTGAEVIKTEEQEAMFGGTAGIAYDPNYHQVGDTYDNLNFEAWLVNTQAIAAAVAEYGTSFDSLPAANTTSQMVKRSYGDPTRHSNPGHCNHAHSDISR